MQGLVCGPLCCTATMDEIGQKSYSSTPYKGMVDDELTIAEFGPDATLTDVEINNCT